MQGTVQVLPYEEAALKADALEDKVVTDLGSCHVFVGKDPAGKSEIYFVNATGLSASITAD